MVVAFVVKRSSKFVNTFFVILLSRFEKIPTLKISIVVLLLIVVRVAFRELRA